MFPVELKYKCSLKIFEIQNSESTPYWQTCVLMELPYYIINIILTNNVCV